MTKKRQMEEVRKQDTNSTCACFLGITWWGEGGLVKRGRIPENGNEPC